MNTLTKSKSEINIGGLDFAWQLENGDFLFEGEPAVLFWITSAMKTFFDTIEEISGEEAANVVLETTGFRQGLVVGEYFRNMDSASIQKAAELIPNTYASAGWGSTSISNLDVEAKTFTVEIKNSWEYRINKEQGKKTAGGFLPAHYAGIFTSLFGTNIWYRVESSQLEEGRESTVIDYFPSVQTVQQNIHELSRKAELERISELENVVNEKTAELQLLVKELSSPIIPVLEGIVVVPLLGEYDEQRASHLVETTLFNLPKHKAEYLVLDLTGLNDHISEYTGHFIQKLGAAAAMIGTETILVGISAEMAGVIARSGIKLNQFGCFQSLQHGIYFALGQKGRKIL